MSSLLHDRVVVVTGGGQGIGREITRVMVGLGAKRVYIAGRNADALSDTATALGPDVVVPTVADLSTPDSVAVIADAVGECDVLINNAGVSQRKDWVDVTLDEWNDVFAVNVTAPFRLAQRFVPGMVRRGWGRVVNIGSIYAGSAPDPRRYPGSSPQIASYVSSKHALHGLTRFLATTVAADGVTVNTISPGFFPALKRGATINDERADALIAGTPANRLGQATDLDAALEFVTSPGAAFVTGQELIVDGGFTLW